MYQVVENKHILKIIDRLPKEIIERYEFWKSVAEQEGIRGLVRFTGFRDHALKGQWRGARSSSLGYQWRVIYVASESKLQIMVLEVNAHDYRQKR